MTHKTNGIAQLFQMTKNKFNTVIEIVKNWIKYTLDPVFENNLWQTQAEIQAWLVTSSPPYPQYFLIGFRRFIKMTSERSGGLFPPWHRPCHHHLLHKCSMIFYWWRNCTVHTSHSYTPKINVIWQQIICSQNWKNGKPVWVIEGIKPIVFRLRNNALATISRVTWQNELSQLLLYLEINTG